MGQDGNVTMSDAKILGGIAVWFAIVSWWISNSFEKILGALVFVLAVLFFFVVLSSYLVEKIRNRPGQQLHIYKRLILSLMAWAFIVAVIAARFSFHPRALF
jgi:hypothetical protein